MNTKQFTLASHDLLELLKQRGFEVPADSVFIAANVDTSGDVRLTAKHASFPGGAQASSVPGPVMPYMR